MPFDMQPGGMNPGGMNPGAQMNASMNGPVGGFSQQQIPNNTVTSMQMQMQRPPGIQVQAGHGMMNNVGNEGGMPMVRTIELLLLCQLLDR